MSTGLFHWKHPRAAGVFLHPTSLPSQQGIGCLGKDAQAFVSFLQAAGMRFWQMSPLGPTGFGDSPYQCFSAFACNPYLIDLEALVGLGLLKDLGKLPTLPMGHVDYGALYANLWPVLQEAYKTSHLDKHQRVSAIYGPLEDFISATQIWLLPYARFQALKQFHNGAPWYTWPSEHKNYRSIKWKNLPQTIAQEVEAQIFYQYLVASQWIVLKEHANRQGIQIIGDVPIFVGLDSADVWSCPEIFQLDAGALPKKVAGVPPDYFSPKGQLWGNPLFDWNALRHTGYAWWLQRMERNLALYDVVRIDHFRGFHDYWAIPADAQDATIGVWEKGPGADFFKTLARIYPDAQLIAEDLGDMSPDVHQLLENTGCPGMAILQFAFGGDGNNPYLPHNLAKNTIVYPGSHDNNTSLGWYRETDERTRDHFRRYLRVGGEHAGWDLIRAAYASPCRLTVTCLQDLMGLGSEARFNYPGRPQGNWQWRYFSHQLSRLHNESAHYLRELATLYAR